jgi:hypothetical protein
MVASFAWSLVTSDRLPAFAYFDTVSRAWELGAGALLAVITPSLKVIGARSGALLSWLGLGILLAGVVLVTPDVAFPGPWALVPVVATCLIIVGGASGVTIAAFDNPVSRYLGTISYSLYLWHFPVIVFTQALFPDQSGFTVAAMLVIMVALSALSYHYLEDPIRRSGWLRRPDRVREDRRRQVAGALVVGVALVGLSAVQLVGPPVVADSSRILASAASTGAAPTRTDPAFATPEALAGSIDAALAASGWPADLSPSLASVGSLHQAPHMDYRQGCRNRVQHRDDRLVCERPGDDRTAVVVGDSVALSWMPAIEAALPGWRVLGFGFAGCPAIPLSAGTESVDCLAAQHSMRQFASDSEPDLIITSSAQSSFTRAPAGNVGEWWLSSVDEFYESYSPLADRVVMLGSPPAGTDPASCVTRHTGPVSCESRVSALWTTKAAAEEAATADARTSAPNIDYIDVEPWFCDTSGACPTFIGATLLRFDGAHLTREASTNFGAVLERELALD